MDKDYILSVANEIRSQIAALTPANVFCSWGVRPPFLATVFHGMPALKFHVSGRLHTGWVIVALDEGLDYYELHLQNHTGTRLVADQVCFDQLSELIDTTIERGTDPAAYEAFCEAERQKLLRGDLG